MRKPGNPNMVKGGPSVNPGGGRKAKLWTDAIMMELGTQDFKELRQIARKTIELAKDGNIAARDCIAERLEGKVPQRLSGDDEGEDIKVLHTIVRKIIEP